ncbi:MAG: nicotinate-nucleotide--dimethylbenzimidazole phosphoribosyltransferase [Candidatus Rokubacteria bacterium]|nr:nicotinate-nucleotide--dimethylbenzimidazole phosphoribosyltransferase [Candidatus Rokubacteria bacterium]
MTSRLRLPDPAAGPDAEAAEQARRRLDALTKPPGSLGRLEELAVHLAAITGRAPQVERPVVFVLAADHGVTAEGVSAYPPAVTGWMVQAFARGRAAINVLARQAGVRVVVADFGVTAPPPPSPGLVACRIGPGTANMARGPAMSTEQAIAAIEHGQRLATEAVDHGADLLLTGDMGIGNTTAAAAITAALCGLEPEQVTGRGTGLDEAGWRRKVEVVRRALGVNRPDPRDGLAVLRALGGFEIAGLVGVILAGAARRVPVVLDGFIAGAAALVAVTLSASVRFVLLAAHRSAEPGHAAALTHLGLRPYLDLGLRLGEGTGAALFVHLARAAARIYAEMATFEEMAAAGAETSQPVATGGPGGSEGA